VKKGDGAGESKLRDFKRLTKLHNVARKEFGAEGSSPRLAVTLRDRLGKNNPNSSLQRKRGSYAGPQMIKRGHGERSDVYLHHKKD